MPSRPLALILLALLLPLVSCASNRNKTLSDIETRRATAVEQEIAARMANMGSGPRNPDFLIPRSLPPGTRATYSRCQVPGPYISLTFDDGPHPTNTPRLLDILKQRNVKATFFVVGRNAATYPHIMRRIAAEGHEIANHTYTHGDITKMSDAALRKELNDSLAAIQNAVPGYRPVLFRPPYGAINDRTRNLITREFGYPSIMWSVDPQDWKRPGVSVVTSRIVNATNSGAIILVHDIHPPSIDAMPSTIDQLLQRGFKFVTTTQLINLERTPANNQLLGSAFGAGVW
jgi:peptidoglycan-N-acetylglucosamine deacetylase